MSATVRCVVCLREERWGDGPVQVIQPGGGRQAPDHAALAAWRTVRAARRGETDPVVAPCAACGQPMIGPAPALTSWSIDTPGGAVVIGETIRGPAGPLAEPAVEAWIRATLPRQGPSLLGKSLFLGFALVLVAAMLAVWVWAAQFVVFFIWFGVPNGALEAR